MGSYNQSYELEYKELIEIIPCGLCVIKDSIIVDCNNAALKIYGYDKKDEFIGLKLFELLPEKRKDRSPSMAFRCLHKRKNGQSFWADIRIYNIHGFLYTVIEEIKDIDLLKQQLSEKDYLYRMLFENHYSVMMLINPDTGNIEEANQSAIKYYGYSKEKLLTMRIQDINILSDDQIREEMNSARTEKRTYFQFTHRLADGELREVEVHSFPIEIEKRKLLFSIVHDISDKVHQKLMYDKLFFDSPEAVVVLDKNQKIVSINKNFTNLFQYTLEEVKGKTVSSVVSTFESRAQIDNNLQLIYQGEIVKQEGRRKRKDGKLIEVEILAYPIINHQVIIGVYIIYIDISGKKAYEKQLDLFRKILENNSEGVVITDTNAHIKWINKAFNEITGFSFDEIAGKRMSILKSGIQDEEFYENMWDQLINSGVWSGEVWNKCKNGDVYSEWLTINSIKDDFNNTAHYVGIFKDLTEKKKIDRRMNDLQQKDPLTGLYNRNYFLEKVNTYIQECFETNDRFSIVFIDLEGFKEINDSLGHVLGDRLLIELSNRLLLLINDNFLLSRFSGDEFVILCKSIKETADMNRFSKVLLEAIKKPFIIENTLLNIIANIGISRFPDNGADAETLVRYADIAMTKAKEKAGDKICFYSKEMSEEIDARFLLANQLIGAISNNELCIYYQPIFNIKDQKTIVGAEALLRWKNPVLGMVPPDKFVPLAEKTGQIIAIGEWVLEQVCKQINFWQHVSSYAVPISVNISVKQLEQVGFAQKVIEVMDRNNVEPDSIELEITESVSSGELFTIVKNLKELKSNGIRISMDDFGTGFSSLGQLDAFELDKLKIDKIFIHDLVHVSRRQSLVKSIIAMAKSLDLTVVAEGIETNEQLLYLQKLGCQLGQGYLFSRPLPAQEIEILLYERVWKKDREEYNEEHR
jgi:diguanylate cyclase (GGDEF)-like protein/PAS domain S-box-containing protein